MSHRLVKVNQNIQRELSAILIEDPVVENGLVTITSVMVTADLREATVWLSVLNNPKPQQAVSLLNYRSSDLYQKLSKRLPMKYVPRLFFRLEEEPEAIERIDALFDDIERGKE